MKAVVLASGEGSNLRALFRASQAPNAAFAVVAVGSDQPACGALAFAKQVGLATFVAERDAFKDRSLWNQQLAQSIEAFAPDFVLLAGFMRIIGAPMLSRWPERILNIHPSLLPAFPGLHAQQQAVRAGVRIAGCTVHLVDDGVDSGAILAQAAVPVLPDDTVETLRGRIQQQEHRLFPLTVDLWCQGKLVAESQKVPSQASLAVPRPKQDAY